MSELSNVGIKPSDINITLNKVSHNIDIPGRENGGNVENNNSSSINLNKFVNMNVEIDSYETKISEDANSGAVSDYFKFQEGLVDNKESVLLQEKNEGQKKVTIEEIDNNNYKNHLDTLKYGTYEKKHYYASNGVTLDYYIYKPDYGTEVEGLPVHIYLHGSGESGNRVNYQSLPKLINNKEITPEGIIISIQVQSNEYLFSSYQDALVELVEKIANENNGDTNKISLSGHSMGAIAGYKIIARYPDTFSAFVPVSGRPTDVETLANSGTKVWFFHGEMDTRCNYNETLSAYEQLKAEGADVDMYTFQGEGHAIQNETFGGKFTDSNGEIIDPLTWAMDQTRDNNHL